MLRKSSHQIFLAVVLLSVLLVVGTASNVGARPEPPPWKFLSGPPIVGRLTLDLATCNGDIENCVPGVLYVNATITGCCAECFQTCKNSCNVKIQQPNSSDPIHVVLQVSNTNNDQVIDLTDVTVADIEEYQLVGRAPKGCRSQRGGEDLIIENVLNLQATANHLVADVVIFYLCPCLSEWP